MKLTIVTIVCVGLINIISEAYGCTCLPGTDQERFCTATFASRGRVTGTRDLKGGQIEYTVEVNYNFKIKVPNTLKVRAYRSAAACGVNLDKGVEYLISGTVTKNRYGVTYRTNSCLWNQRWQNIKSDTRRKLLSGQFNNC
ncbi:NTR domain-containing protein-like [Mytilus californianus]|uniref:NTR domain-containing protein-like n=1 Tax=Mytilus californianus TaxID=6549 RepID=UPI002245F8FB|nr:NTR domain-containing protein-like [Mytilus californianus]